MTETLPIFKLTHTSGDILENHLEGLMYGKFEDSNYKSSWKKQWFSNELYLKELEELGPIFEKSELSQRPVLVKGCALLHTVYKDKGSRFMSDCDLLVSPDDLHQVRDIFIQRGFKVIKSSTWFANDFKIQMNKVIDGVELNFELHSKLLFHHDYNLWNKISLNEYYDTLSLKDHIIYLCAHLGFAHSFLKLYWLFDIYFVLEENSSVTYESLRERAKELKILNSLKMSFWCLSCFFNKKYKPFEKSPLYNYLFNETFMWKVKQSGHRYFLIKHFSKDNFFLALKYDFLWALNKLIGK
jgi:hypothetical protein